MNLIQALRSISESWTRAVLSAVGVAVASVAVLLLVSIALGVQKDLTSEIDDLGADVLVVVPGKIEFGNFNPNLGGQSFLSDEAADNVRQVDGVRQVAKWTFAGGGISANGQDAYPVLIATSPEWFDIHGFQLSEGKLPTLEDRDRSLAVLGSIAKRDLFGSAPAVGKTVTVNGIDYTVAAVMQEQEQQSAFSMQSLANVVYLPFDVVQQAESTTQIDRLMIQFDTSRDPETLVPRIEQALSRSLEEQQFSVLTQEDLLGLIYQVFAILATLVVGLTSIALFVGGVGIMAIMLMSVGERSKEIGVRMATGARRQDIFRQFLAESVIVSLAGVIVGLLFSLIVIAVIDQTTTISPLVTWQTVVMAFALGIGLGSVFGVWPASRASRLHPVEALRNE